MAEFLVLAKQGYTNPDPEKDRRGCYKKGDVIFVHEDGDPWGAMEVPPDFVLLKVPGVTRAQVENYRASWTVELFYEVLASDPTTDTFSIRVTNQFPGAAQQASLTRAQVEAFLADWNATVTAVAANSVTFSVRIYSALTSVGMWGEHARIGGAQVIGFDEQVYDQASGLHTIRADYSATPVKASEARTQVESRGGTVLSNDGGAIVFQMNRADARAVFQQDVAARARQIFKRRRYAFSAADVDSALAAGGAVTLTPAQASARLLDATA